MKLIPNGRRLLVLPIEAQDETRDSGVIVPAGIATANLSKGEVVEVSKDLDHKFEVGDIVLYATNAGQSQLYNGKYHVWLAEREFDSDIWGIELRN